MSSELTLSDLAGKIGARLEGDGGVRVSGIAPIEEAGPGQVTFLSNPKYTRFARDSKAAAIIAKNRVEGSTAAFLLSENPYYAFAVAVETFHPRERFPEGISTRASVHSASRMGKGVHVADFCVVEEGAVVGDRTVLMPGVYVGRGTRVGEDCLFYPHVVLYAGVTVGNRAIFHAGCVVGSDGFGFAPSKSGYRKIPQVGTVEIGDDVELGANTTVDRAALGVTRIGPGTKLDNLVQVGHNVEIGGNTVIAAQTGIAGSCKIGSWVMIGGQAGLAGHIEVGDGVMVAAKSGVAETLSASEGRAWSGIPTMPHTVWLRMVKLLPKLPELFRRVKRLEEESKPKGDG